MTGLGKKGRGKLVVDDLPRVDLALARELIDYDPKSAALGLDSGFGTSQLEGCVQAFNMLATNRVAYLADEVGLGKTYVALGVAALLRHLSPSSRIMVIAPRENIQAKWIKEQRNFVRNNWRLVDNRVRSIQRTPARCPVFVRRLQDWVHELAINDRRDLFLRMTSFSPSFKQVEDRRKLRIWLRKELPWIEKSALSAKSPEGFRDEIGRVLNAAVPQIDLLIVDEAHNLKHGFGSKVATRNRLMGLAFGHPEGASEEAWWYGPRVKRLLLLSATPFESDLSALYRQLDLFGMGGLALGGPDGLRDASVSDLADPNIGDDEGREIARRFLIRRIGHLRAGGERLTKNLYRREWRCGGLDAHDEPMQLADPKQRLVVGLVQRKVAELLGNERFGNQFQIGMLSSFESFLESVTRKRQRIAEQKGDEDDEPTFDDSEQTIDAGERRGIDTDVLERIVHGYRERFGESLPHPKLDATTDAMEASFTTGEKALVFVRRVATVGELAAKLRRRYDRWILERLRTALPQMREELDAQFERYLRESDGRENTELNAEDEDESLEERELIHRLEEDQGGTEDFFSWFFRGDGPSGVLSGAAFQRNRLSNASSAYSTLFEDDHVARLLARPKKPLEALAAALERRSTDLEVELKRLAWAHYLRSWKRRESGYSRLYLFESYQAAALWLMHLRDDELGGQAKVILHERFPSFGGEQEDPPETFSRPDGFIGIDTFFTELTRRPVLREALWPEDVQDSWPDTFRRSEQRRELLSAMARLGAAYVDLWALAVRPLGTLALGQASDRAERPDRDLAIAFLDLLERQRDEPSFGAYRELAGAAEAFDTLIAVNFPELPSASLTELPRILTRTLQHQMPVGAMAGSVNHRVVRQFRMPGYPLVLATTDVLQEGEDLHTFCRKVVHYGISWTPSAMEQRTGRVDRIGSLAQRAIDGSDVPPAPNEKIQVYYPHLPGTIEVLQVRRVLRRLDQFLCLAHEGLVPGVSDERKIHAGRELLSGLAPPEPPRGPLETAFPVRETWLSGDAGPEKVCRLDVEALEDWFRTVWDAVVRNLCVRRPTDRDRTKVSGELRFLRGVLVPTGSTDEPDLIRHQGFDLELRSRATGDATLVRCTSHVGLLNLADDDTLDQLYDLQRTLDHARVCLKPDLKHGRHEVRVERSLLFHPETTQIEEVEELVLETTRQADQLEEVLLARDEGLAEHLTREADDG